MSTPQEDHSHPPPKWSSKRTHPVDLEQFKSKPDQRVSFSKRASISRYILNWEGYMTITVINKIPKLSLKHDFGCTVLELKDPVLRMLNDNKRLDCDSLLKLINREYCFDAVWRESYWKIRKLFRSAKCSSQKLLLDKLCSHRAVIDSGTWCSGRITSIPFHDAALASVADLPVLVPIESLVIEDLMSSPWSAMNMFVHEGSRVAMKITQSGEGLIRAEQCLKTGVPKEEKIELESYLTKWGTSEKIHKGVLQRKGDAMYCIVKLSTCCIVRGSFLPVRTDKIFAKGQVATESQLNGSLGTEVSCICQPGNKEVMFAWFGDFEPWVLLQDKLVVPKGIVKCNSRYDTVVEEFPLPGHAICRIGVLPVLLEISNKCDYARGDIMPVYVTREEVVNGGCCLVARFIQTSCDPRCVVNFRGCVASVGALCSIKCDDCIFDIVFEWSVLKPFKARPTDISTYFKQVREFVKVGTNVQFTAIIPDLQLNGPDLQLNCVEVNFDAEL